MSATERLRELLDERGADYRVSATGYSIDIGPYTTAYANRSDTTLDVSLRQVTPEQAIAATLGPGTCRLHDCDGSFSSVNRPVWRCDCGAFMTQYTDATTYHKPRFCPNCGRKVVDE